MSTSTATSRQELATRLLDVAGTTYAAEAGIKLANTPAPLYRTLVLAVLLSARIKADIAVAATHELLTAGLTTPRRMCDAEWQTRVDALGRGHYVRYDESTATALGQGAQLLLTDYGGDLRTLREAAHGDASALAARLRALPKLGPVGVHIFFREVQRVWPELCPYLDKKALDGAGKLGLPTDAAELATLVPENDMARFAAALVRVALDRQLLARVRE